MEMEQQRPLAQIHDSWTLHQPAEPTRKKPLRKWFLSTSAIILLTIVVVMVTTTRRHHHKPPVTQPPENYTVALQKALQFFNAQRSGELPDQNNVSWRGDSCLHDGISTYNLVGGYYDAGDAVKSNYPTSFSMTVLSWSVIEYRAKYEAAGELNHVKSLIRWGTDYFLNNFDASSDNMVSQVGSRKTSETSTLPNDQNCWMRPEDIDYNRPVSFCYYGCSDLAAEMAAALASASIVFSDNETYSHKLLAGATTLYKFAEAMKDGKTDSGMYWDDLLWARTWMFYATGDLAHLDRVTSHDLANRAGAFSSGPSYGVLSWSNKLIAAQLLLTRLRLFLGPGYPYEEMLREFHYQTGTVMCSYLPYFNKFNRTKGGLILLNHGEPQALQYAANAAFLASLFSDYLEAADTPGWYCGHTFYSNDILRQFSRSQLDYILGKNPQNMSYLVGFGERYPTHVHHRGASIPKNKKVSCQGGLIWKQSSKGNPNMIVGALVAGPDKHDGFHDDRRDYNYTEPTLAGNAGLVAALVALAGEKRVDVNTMFSAVHPMFPDTPPPPAAWRP